MTNSQAPSQTGTRKIVLLVLGILVVGTVFFLPRFVTEPWVSGAPDDLPPVPEASPTTVAPSTAAELTRYRQDSQNVLAEIIALRDRLRERNVEQWAEADFQQALDRVEAGDERYSFGDYAASLEQFRQARDQLAGIEEMGLQKLSEAKTAAASAVESLNPIVARSSIELALAIAPDDPEVQALAARVGTLEQVAAHIEAGDRALSLDQFPRARSEYQKAVDLDPAHARANRSLASAGREVTDSTFRGHMSRGFAALERRDYEAARTAFREAGKIRPGDDAVRTALDQVDNRESADVVSGELRRAAELEADEQWAEALAIYEALLADDPSLTDAKVKLIPARVRAELDVRLSGFIEEPLRLSAEADFRAAQSALRDARGIPEPGPRLTGQIDRLDELLERADTPVDVVFRSDNQTHVVLFRVADLGRFDQVSVRLRPGRYIAAGTRTGYRDVRVEFTITGEPMDKPILVRCEEPIG